MKYMGSKRRIAKEILPIILKDRKEGQCYTEPFCGGCNSLDKVTGNRIGNDSNKYLIAFLNEMKKDNFDHEKFWGWCEEMVNKGHQVFVSEYNAPENWKCVWAKEVITGLDVTATKKDVEKLFVFDKIMEISTKL